jgi:hypothetical protein
MLASLRVMGLPLALLILRPAAMLAQREAFPNLPSAATCDSIRQGIASGTASASAWATLPNCPPGLVGEAVAQAIGRFGSDGGTDGNVFSPSAAGLVRDDRVFDAAIALAGHRAASVDARVAALEMIGLQVDENFVIGLRGDSSCSNEYPVGGLHPVRVRPPLDVGRRGLIPPLLADISLDRSLPLQVRLSAKCMARRLSIPVPPDVKPGDFTASLDCSRRLTIVSHSPDQATLVLVMGPDSTTIMALPDTSTGIYVRPAEVLRLALGSEVIWAGGWPPPGCPR